MADSGLMTASRTHWTINGARVETTLALLSDGSTLATTQHEGREPISQPTFGTFPAEPARWRRYVARAGYRTND